MSPSKIDWRPCTLRDGTDVAVAVLIATWTLQCHGFRFDVDGAGFVGVDASAAPIGLAHDAVQFAEEHNDRRSRNGHPEPGIRARNRS
jgi:hypothetical protein